MRLDRALHLATVISAIFLAGIASAGPPVPGQVAIEDLEHTRDWLVEVDGEVVDTAEAYYSEYEVAWLLQVPSHGYLLLSPRGSSVQRVEEEAFSLTGETTGRLEPLGGAEVVAEFTQSRQVMSFELEGHSFEVRPAPPILGRQSSIDVGQRHPDFEQKSSTYQQKMAHMAAPVQKAAAEDLMVRVYFGSWSPICKRIVPKIMALEESWQHIRFEYYGLPQPLVDDPHAEEMGITGVPTLVIFQSGEAVERLTGRQLDDPEEVLSRALGGAR